VLAVQPVNPSRPPPVAASTLVDVAARLLVEEGPDKLSLRRLAAEAGTSTMAVYTRFGDKGRLLAAMHHEGFRRLGVALHDVPRTPDPVADLYAMGLAYRQAALASRHLYSLMFGRPLAELSEDEQAQAVARAAYEPLIEGVRRCQEAGAMTPEDTERVALHLWATAHGMVSLELNDQLPPATEPPARLYEQALTYAALPFLRTR
jgi:AcrR family transcriptional regulator